MSVDLADIKCEYIKKVFTNCVDNLDMLSVKDFIAKSGFPIDNFMVDNFFTNLQDDIPIYVTNELIEWCGYSGNKDDKKRRFKDLLNHFKENKDFWIYSNQEYESFYDNSMHFSLYPNPGKFKGRNKTKHFVLSVDCLKQIMLMLKTNKADSIRKHFIQMEKLIVIYMKYQCIVLKLNFKAEIDELRNLKHIKKYSALQRINELEEELQKKYKVGVIYFICEADNPEVVKIGYTYNLLDRVAQLQCAHYKDLVVKNYYFAQFPSIEEKRLHKFYSKLHVRGEWFNLKN